MAMRIADATRNAMADAITLKVDLQAGAGTIKVYTGTQPADADDAVGGGDTLLATFTLDTTSFGAASAGTITLAGVPKTTTGAAAGTAGWFRVEDASGNNVFDGSVTATGGGGQLELNTTTISSGVNVEITAGTVTIPASG